MKVDSLSEFGLPKDVLVHMDRKEQNFSKHLSAAKDIHLKNQMNFELDAINEIGRRLSENMFLSDLKEYRHRISKFLRTCISQGFHFKEEQFSAHQGRSKILSIIKIIDQKLIDLAEEFLSKEQDSLKILTLIDEIRGLLLDFYA